MGTYIDKAANLKTLVTHDVLPLNRKFKSQIAYQFFGFMIQCLNEFRRITDKSESLYRRFCFVPFNKSFTGQEKRYIKNDFIARDEVLQYVVRRVLELTPDYYELANPQACQVVMAEFKETNDPIRAFWNEFRDHFAWGILPGEFLYDLYRAWFAQNTTPAACGWAPRHSRRTWTA